MSIEILYDKRFIKIDENKYIPMVLMGSSNCTMFVGNREILERAWSPLFGKKTIYTRDELLEIVNSCIANTRPDYDGEWFTLGGRGGKWVTNKNIVDFINNACNKAITIEEYSKNGYPVKCSISYHRDCEWKNTDVQYIHDTKSLVEWIESAQTKEMEGYAKYINVEFLSIKPLKIASNKHTNNPFVVKHKNGYITEVKENSYCTSVDLADAKVFTDYAEYEEIYLPMLRRFRGTFKVVDYNNLIKRKQQNRYYIHIAEGARAGMNIKRTSPVHIFFVGTPNNAKKFSSVKSAEKYIAEKLFNHETYAKRFEILSI